MNNLCCAVWHGYTTLSLAATPSNTLPSGSNWPTLPTGSNWKKALVRQAVGTALVARPKSETLGLRSSTYQTVAAVILSKWCIGRRMLLQRMFFQMLLPVRHVDA